MDALILSRNVAIYSTRRLTEAFRARGRRAVVMDPASISVRLPGDPGLFTDGGSPLPLPRVVVPRIGHGITDHALAVLRRLETAGVPLTAGSGAVRDSRDKMCTLERLAAAGLPVPRTVLLLSPSGIDWAVEAVGGPPVVMKFLSGTHGVGVFLVESLESARSLLEALWEMGRNVLVQHYVGGTAGHDLRFLVVGDRVPAAIRRHAPPGTFRANLHLGGRAEPLDPDPDLVHLALAAARALDLGIAGVDILEGEEGPLLLEVNSSPGLEGIEEATGVDVAAEIVDAALCVASGGGL